MIGPIKRALFEYSAAWGIYQRDHVRGVATDVDRDAVDKLHHRLINLIDSIEVSDDLVDPRDIFNHLKEFNSPGKIQIVAPGPNGIRHYYELNPDYLTIVVNKAVELPIKKDIWIVADYKQSTTTDWFPYGIKNHADIACLQTEWVSSAFPQARWSFDAGPLIQQDDISVPFNGVLRYGTTSSGQALQLAYWLGAKEIIMCGLDFNGSGYYDGTGRNLPLVAALWKVKEPMNELLKWIRGHGIITRSISETALVMK